MEYTYEVDDNNKVTIIQTGTTGVTTLRNTLSQPNSPSDGTTWTKEEAEQWAETTIQTMKDNGDVFATPTHNKAALEA
jgi:hypothetical protein